MDAFRHGDAWTESKQRFAQAPGVRGVYTHTYSNEHPRASPVPLMQVPTYASPWKEVTPHEQCIETRSATRLALGGLQQRSQTVDRARMANELWVLVATFMQWAGEGEKVRHVLMFYLFPTHPPTRTSFASASSLLLSHVTALLLSHVSAPMIQYRIRQVPAALFCTISGVQCERLFLHCFIGSILNPLCWQYGRSQCLAALASIPALANGTLVEQASVEEAVIDSNFNGARRHYLS